MPSSRVALWVGIESSNSTTLLCAIVGRSILGECPSYLTKMLVRNADVNGRTSWHGQLNLYANVALISTNMVFYWRRARPETSGNITRNMVLLFMIILTDHFHASLYPVPRSCLTFFRQCFSIKPCLPPIKTGDWGWKVFLSNFKHFMNSYKEVDHFIT